MRFERSTVTRTARRSLMLFAAAAIPVTVVTFAVLSAGQNTGDRATRTSKAQNIAITFGDPSTFALDGYPNAEIFPEGLRPEPSDDEHIAAALDGIEQALTLYPSGFASKLIRAVFICGVLHAGPARASGTIGDKWIVVAAPTDRSVDDVRQMSAATFHHELSSAVLRQPGFRERWMQYWPDNQAVVREYDQVAREASEASPDPATGFLSAYAKTNPENDFNVYAEELFMNSAKTKRLAEQYPLVNKKLRSLIEMYIALDPRFNDRIPAS